VHVGGVDVLPSHAQDDSRAASLGPLGRYLGSRSFKPAEVLGGDCGTVERRRTDGYERSRRKATLHVFGLQAQWGGEEGSPIGL
jgi:hypothetical protein